MFVAIFGVIVGLINAEPIKFWRKSAYIISVLMAIVLFAVTRDIDDK